MARRTFENFVTNVQLRMGNRSDVTDELTGWWVNDALKRLCAEFEHPQLESTTTGTVTTGNDTLTPSNYGSIWWPTMVKDTTNGTILQPTDKEKIEYGAKRSSERPSRFYWWARQYVLDVNVSANTDFKVWYIASPSEASTGTLLTDEMWDPIIEMFAAVHGFNVLRDFQAAHFAEVEANNWMAAMNPPRRKSKLLDWNARIEVTK